MCGSSRFFTNTNSSLHKSQQILVPEKVIGQCLIINQDKSFSNNGVVSNNFSSNWTNKPSMAMREKKQPKISFNPIRNASTLNENCSIKVLSSQDTESSVTPNDNVPINNKTIQRSFEKVVEWSNKNAAIPG